MIQRTIADCLSDRWQEFTRVDPGEPIEVDWTGLKNQLETVLRRLLKRELRGQSVLVFLIQVPHDKPVAPARQPISTSA